MPELPEVETVRKILLPRIKNHRIVDITILKSRIVQTDATVFKHTLIGKSFKDVRRIGKFLIFDLEDDVVIVSHLRMEGKYIEVLPGQDLSRYACVVFTLEDGRKMCYDDSRQFGTMTLTNRRDYIKDSGLSRLGPEPFDADPLVVYKQFKHTARSIKAVLLDQSIMTGLGNIYVDETLFLAKLHPEHPANKLNLEQVKILISYACEVLNKALDAGGSTIRSYHPGNGITGDFQSQLNAYGRDNLPCHVCSHKMKKIFVGGRGTTYCPRCQRHPTRALAIAITGMIGAGKSTVGLYLKSKGFSVIDSDQMVRDLYRERPFTRLLEDALRVKLHTRRRFDKQKLRDAILINPKLLKTVEKLVHPIIKKRIFERINAEKNSVIFFEIPLVFSHKINELFPYIIGIETDKATQEHYLELRGQNVVASPDVQYLKNRAKIDAIIINNATINKLYQDIDSVLINLEIH